MKSCLKNQNVLLSLDQAIDSGLVFIFIALGGVLLQSEEMANVIISQSFGLVCVLFCSCFTTQYLLLKYSGQSIIYWLKHFVLFFTATAIVIFCLYNSLDVFLLFSVGVFSEFIKRICFYKNLSLFSLISTICTFMGFFSLVVIYPYAANFELNGEYYIFSYSVAKIFPLLFLLVCLFFKDKVNKIDIIYNEHEFLYETIKQSIKCGGVFSVITIIYWCINQGFVLYFKDILPPGELVNIRVSQNIFGVVTMLIALYDAIFLKKHLNIEGKIFNINGYLKFILTSSLLILFNVLFLYVLSLTIYKSLDILRYTFFLALSQWLFLMSRMPILIIKLRYNLFALLFIYVVSLLFSVIYMFIAFNNIEFIFIIKAISLANFLILVLSISLVVYKEKIYEFQKDN